MIRAEFNKNVAEIARHSAGLAAQIQNCAMFALEHCNVHGNTDPMNMLVAALHVSQRKQALVAWFQDCSKAVLQDDKTFKYSKDKAIVVLINGVKTEFTIDEAIIFADENPYYDYTHESKPPSSFDILKAVEGMLRKIERYTSEGKTVEHYELKEKLAALLPVE